MSKVLFKGKPVLLSGNFPKVGDPCPGFCLTTTALEDKSLNDFKGKTLLLYFAPSLDTGVCLLSTKKIDAELEKRKASLGLIISSDLPFALSRICGLENLKHITPLSAIRSKETFKNFGLLIEEGPLKGFCARALLVVSSDLKILYTELVSEITQEPNYELAFKHLT